MKRKKKKDVYVIIGGSDIDWGSIWDKEALEWNKLPENIFNDVPEWYYQNRMGINKDGDIVEKTVVFLRKAKEDEDISDEEYIIYEDQERIIGLEMP